MLSHQKIQETDESSLFLLLAYGGDCPKKISFLLEAQLGLREKEKREEKTIVCSGSSNGNHHQRFCLDLASQGRLTA